MTDIIHTIEFPDEHVVFGALGADADEAEVAKFFQAHETESGETLLVHEHQQRDAEFDVVRLQFELAYVCAFMEVELHSVHPILRYDDVTSVIDLVQEALCDERHDLLGKFDRPSLSELRNWLKRYRRHPVVLYHHEYSRSFAALTTDRAALVTSIADHAVWNRVHRAYQTVFVRWMHRAVPEINGLSNYAEMMRAVSCVEQHHRLSCRFKLTEEHLRDWLGVDDICSASED
ncbi:MAG: hypothetical protein WDN50_07880 [Bradyrhizobium sp.]